jgi:hypothetical protein
VVTHAKFVGKLPPQDAVLARKYGTVLNSIKKMVVNSIKKTAN